MIALDNRTMYCLKYVMVTEWLILMSKNAKRETLSLQPLPNVIVQVVKKSLIQRKWWWQTGTRSKSTTFLLWLRNTCGQCWIIALPPPTTCNSRQRNVWTTVGVASLCQPLPRMQVTILIIPLNPTISIFSIMDAVEVILWYSTEKKKNMLRHKSHLSNYGITLAF